MEKTKELWTDEEENTTKILKYLINKNGLPNVLLKLAGICFAKASHAQVSLGEKEHAIQWSHLGLLLTAAQSDAIKYHFR